MQAVLQNPELIKKFFALNQMISEENAEEPPPPKVIEINK
jgi:hypothetical protein